MNLKQQTRPFAGAFCVLALTILGTITAAQMPRSLAEAAALHRAQFRAPARASGAISRDLVA